MTLVACHQPDLFPYSGFWYKMVHSDIFVLLAYDQFQKRGYQRRVKMRGRWCSHFLIGNPVYEPINEVRVHDGWQQHLVDVIRGRYAGSPYWKKRGPDLCAEIFSTVSLGEEPALVDVNVALLRMMQERLSIGTPMVFTDQSIDSTKGQRILDHVLAAGGTEYLAGTGALTYMADAEKQFAEAGVGLLWSKHARRSDDSVLTAYFDEADPMDAILSEES